MAYEWIDLYRSVDVDTKMHISLVIVFALIWSERRLIIDYAIIFDFTIDSDSDRLEK